MNGLRNTVLRALVSLTVVGALLATAGITHGHSASATTTAPNSNVQVVNVSDQSFGVAWSTSTKETGSSITFGTSCAKATTPATETPSSGFVHLANTPGGLTRNTTYYFKIVTKGGTDNNGGSCYTAKTYPAQPLPPVPTAVYGATNTGSGCATAASGTLVMITVTHSGATSRPLATITDTSGRWALPFNDVTTSTGGFVPSASGDRVNITATRKGATSQTVGAAKVSATKLIGPVPSCVA